MNHKDQYALLNVEEMARADQLTIRSGIPGCDLMEAAGLSVVRHIMGKYEQAKTLILCGPGNNGGDGFVIARHLKAAGWDVEIALLGSATKLVGDAASMAKKWHGSTLRLKADYKSNHQLVVDAIFGAGLSRPVTGEVAKLIDGLNMLQRSGDVKIIAVDVPTGVEGDSGQVRAAGIRANSTVTFFRKKPGHLLYPGREYCGEITVADIGILERVLEDIKPEIFRNDPILWLDHFPWPAANSHKYMRGHALIMSGGSSTGGAARLSAKAALRIGAGLVSVVCPDEALQSHAAQLTAVMIKPYLGVGDIEDLLDDKRLVSWCVGPGNGVTVQTQSHVLKILEKNKLCVIDADGLSVFADNPSELFQAIKKTRNSPVLTPHDGEFSRLFPDLARESAGYNKLDSARKAAERSGAVIILKGPDTVIACPDGRAMINDNAPPQLATAGSGDVLAGICTGLMAQGMAPYEAACAAVWIHGAAATAFGLGLTSEDIIVKIPEVLKELSALTD